MGGYLTSFAGDQTEDVDPPKPLRSVVAAGAGSLVDDGMPNTPFNKSWAVVPADFG
jgi:hypothetical protein